MHATLRFFRPALAACALGLAGHALAQSGSSASPFMPAAGPVAAAAGPSETLEFAGINVMGSKTLVSVYDKTAKKGRWIEVGGSDGPYTVLAFDPRREQIVVKTAEFQKTLTLRKSNGPTAVPVPVAAMPAASGFAVPSPIAFSNAAPAPGVPTDAVGSAPAPAAPPVEAAPAPAPAPAKPQTVARQEEEARMLVSDLLEIGMAQRRAYEEAQRKAASTPPASTPPAATPAPGGG